MASSSSLSQASLGGKTASSTKSETVNYLLLYEAMVRHQDLEFDATRDHIALTVGRIQFLGRKTSSGTGNGSSGDNHDGSSAPKGMLTYLQMRRCLLRLGYTWNRSLPQDYNNNGGNSGSSIASYDDDVSVMSANSASTFISGGGASAKSGNTSTNVAAARDIIATDAQLIMLLTTLVEMEERHRAVKLALAEEEDDEDDNNHHNDNDENEMMLDALFSQGLFLPEFIQAYKLIIGGMQSLQTYPSLEDRKGCATLGLPANDSLQELRDRSRERTLGLLRLFGPDSKLYKREIMAVAASSSQSAGESPSMMMTTPSKKASMNRSSSFKGKTKKANMTAKDGLLPRLTEEEIRKMVHSKDTALANILEEHESEMNVMAVNMEQLRKKGIATQSLMKRRRKRTRTAVVVGFILLLCGGAFYEYRKQEQVRTEIASGREAERRADESTISSLKERLSVLQSKLSDAEATIRYEENRFRDLSKKHDKSAKTLEESRAQWIEDRGDLENCLVSRKELDVELTTVKAKNEEVTEEVGWCRERLASAERAVESLELALKKKKKSEGGGGIAAIDTSKAAAAAAVAPSGASTTIETTDGSSSDAAGKKSKKKRKIKPVQMEMKYNKSFRNAVILRQVYSAAGGMVLSALFPGIGKVLGLLFPAL